MVDAYRICQKERKDFFLNFCFTQFRFWAITEKIYK